MKHQLLQAQKQVLNYDLKDCEGIKDHIIYNLVHTLAEQIIKNKIYKLTEIPDVVTDTTDFLLSLGIVNPDDFIILRKIIERYNFQFVDEHNKITNLKELL